MNERLRKRMKEERKERTKGRKVEGREKRKKKFSYSTRAKLLIAIANIK